MNFRECFLAAKNLNMYDVHSSFSNNYLLKHGNIFSYGVHNEFFIPVPHRSFLNLPKLESTSNKAESRVPIRSSVHETPSPTSELPLTNENGKQETWILGNQKLSWDNSTVASYNPETKMFRCVVCNAVGFLSRIAEHYLGTHTSAKVFQCLHCPYSSTWSRCVRMHMAKHHGVPNAPPSLWKGQPLLEEIFHLLNTLKSSVDGLGREKSDTPDKKFVCSKCPYNTDRRDLYLRHENIHKEEKPYHCYLCMKLFNRADHVKKHFLRIHRGQPYDIALVRRRPPELESHDKRLTSDEYAFHLPCEQVLLPPNESRERGLSPQEPIKRYLEDGKENSPSGSVTSKHPGRVPAAGLFACPACNCMCTNKDSLLTHVISFHDNATGADAARLQECKVINGSDDSNIWKDFWQTGRKPNRSQDTLFGKIRRSSCGEAKANHANGSHIPVVRGDSGTERNGTINTESPHPKTPRWKATEQEAIRKRVVSVAEGTKDRGLRIQPKPDPPVDCDIVCRHCGCEFADLSSLETHTELYHRSHSSAASSGCGTSALPFVCVVCLHRCASQVSMMEHMRCHSGPSLKCLAGRLCTFSAVYDSDLLAHVAQRHNDGFTRCPHCGLPCSTQAAFARHYRFSHHPFPCGLCRNIPNSHRCDSVLSPPHREWGLSTLLQGTRSRPSTDEVCFSDAKQGLCSARRCRKQSSPRKVIHSEKYRVRSSQKWRSKLPLMNAKYLWWRRRCRPNASESQMQQVHICRLCQGRRRVRYKLKKSLIVHRFLFHSRSNFCCLSCGARFRLQYQLLLHTKRQHSTKTPREFPLPLISRETPS